MEYAINNSVGWSEKDQRFTVEILTNRGVRLIDGLANSHEEAMARGRAQVQRKAQYGPGRGR